MGSSVSIHLFRNQKNSKSIQCQSYLENILPGYYIENVVLTRDDIAQAKASWDMIMSKGFTRPFHKRKNSDPSGFSFSTPLLWLVDEFYRKLFEICPDVREMFDPANTLAKGRLFGGVISSALEAYDYDKLKYRMEYTAQTHVDRGIKADHFCKLGFALVSSLEIVIGPQFNDSMKIAWYRIYSTMLSIILPLVVPHEIEQLTLRKSFIQFPSSPVINPPLPMFGTSSLRGSWSRSFKMFDKHFLPMFEADASTRAIREEEEEENDDGDDDDDGHDGQQDDNSIDGNSLAVAGRCRKFSMVDRSTTVDHQSSDCAFAFDEPGVHKIPINIMIPPHSNTDNSSGNVNNNNNNYNNIDPNKLVLCHHPLDFEVKASIEVDVEVDVDITTIKGRK